jgi:ankyrin repeat protein
MYWIIKMKDFDSNDVRECISEINGIVLPLLLQIGLDPDLTNYEISILGARIEADDLFSVRLLVEKGADTMLVNDQHETALMLAVGFGHEEIVKYLLEIGMDPNGTLCYARKFPRIYKLLVESGAELDQND